MIFDTVTIIGYHDRIPNPEPTRHGDYALPLDKKTQNVDSVYTIVFRI